MVRLFPFISNRTEINREFGIRLLLFGVEKGFGSISNWIELSTSPLCRALNLYGLSPCVFLWIFYRTDLFASGCSLGWLRVRSAASTAQSAHRPFQPSIAGRRPIPPPSQFQSSPQVTARCRAFDTVCLSFWKKKDRAVQWRESNPLRWRSFFFGVIQPFTRETLRRAMGFGNEPLWWIELEYFIFKNIVTFNQSVLSFESRWCRFHRPGTRDPSKSIQLLSHCRWGFAFSREVELTKKRLWFSLCIPRAERWEQEKSALKSVTT